MYIIRIPFHVHYTYTILCTSYVGRSLLYYSWCCSRCSSSMITIKACSYVIFSVVSVVAPKVILCLYFVGCSEYIKSFLLLLIAFAPLDHVCLLRSWGQLHWVVWVVCLKWILTCLLMKVAEDYRNVCKLWVFWLVWTNLNLVWYLLNLKCPTAVPVLTSHVQCARPCPLCHLFSMCRVLSSTSCSDSVSVVLTRHFPILSLYFLAAANPLPECETSSECGIPINT